VFEGPSDTPLLRLGWNKQDPRHIATVLADSPKVVILDIRYPTVPVAQLARHTAAVNALAWAPHSAGHVCTAGDDSQARGWGAGASAAPLPHAPAEACARDSRASRRRPSPASATYLVCVYVRVCVSMLVCRR
jgi:hypothetical protein